MTGPDVPTEHDPYRTAAGQPVEMTLSKEVLRLGTEWTVAGSIRLRRRIITETRTVQVTLRREELEIEVAHVDHDRDGTLFGTRLDGPVTDPPQQTPPVIIVLQQEIPEIRVRLEPYEKVSVATALVGRTGQVHANLSHEQLQLDTATPTAEPRHRDQ